MAIIKKQDKKNEKEEKDLQAGKSADKLSLDDEQLEFVAGGFEFSEAPHKLSPDIVCGTEKIKNFGT